MFRVTVAVQAAGSWSWADSSSELGRRAVATVRGGRVSVLVLGCLLLAGVVAAPAAANLRAASLGPASPRAAVSAQPTALAVTAQAAPQYVRGSDDRTHLDYDLLITNWLPGTVTVRSIKVLTPRGTLLLELAGEELAAHTHLVSAGAPPTASIPASATVVTIIDVAVPQRDASHRPDPPHQLRPPGGPATGSARVDRQPRSQRSGAGRQPPRPDPDRRAPARTRLVQRGRLLPGVGAAPPAAVSGQRHLGQGRDVRDRLAAGARRRPGRGWPHPRTSPATM